MGMDVSGRNPRSQKGEYFRNNVWWWRPLWDYCCDVAPMCRSVNGHTNDGDGLDEIQACELAEVLAVEITSGRCAEYEKAHTALMDALPDEECQYCAGTGDRKDLEPPEWKEKCGGCNACNGKGTVRPFASLYPFSVENVREFAEFVADSGGFEIW